MKFLTTGLALSAVSLLSTAGCSAPATSSAPAEPPASVPASATADAPPSSASSAKPATPAKTADTAKPTTPAKATDAKTTKAAAPDSRYRVESDPTAKYGGQAPPTLVNALRKAQVPPPPRDMKMAAKPRVVLETSKGAITVELDPKAAPLQVKSFVYLSNLHFFDGTVFHRHADLSGDGKGFIIQGGDPFTKTPALAEFFGTGGPGYMVPREKNSLTHNQFVIAAARSQDPDSAGSQFYITQGPVHFLDEGYTVFGKVVDGKEVALKLSQDDTLKSAKVQK